MGNFRRSIIISILTIAYITSVAGQETPPAVRDLPENPQERFNELQTRAGQALDNGEYQDALTFYEMMEEIAPDGGEVAYNQGTIHLQLEAYDTAIVHFSRAEDAGLRTVALFYNRGNAYFHRGDLAVASEEYRKALDIDPQDSQTLNNLGLTELRLGREDAAEEFLVRASESDETFGEPLFHLATLYDQRGNLSEAEEALTEALGRNNQMIEGYYNRGLIRYRLGQYRAALDDFLQAHALDPEDLDIIHNLGVTALAVAGASGTAE